MYPPVPVNWCQMLPLNEKSHSILFLSLEVDLLNLGSEGNFPFSIVFQMTPGHFLEWHAAVKNFKVTKATNCAAFRI